MSDDIPSELPPKEDHKAVDPTYLFPKVDGPTSFYDDVERVAWVAIPFDKISDPHFVTASLDRSKFDVLNYLGTYIRGRNAREALASKTKQKTGIFAKLGL